LLSPSVSNRTIVNLVYFGRKKPQLSGGVIFQVVHNLTD